MSDFWYMIADLFSYLFVAMEYLGNSLNYVYILIIFIFLMGWIFIMRKHKKNNEEHAPL
tara:strand:+ start:952 stop:1128 length:177 start_codon:yes stop_codon:yes gene_type:complete